MEVKVDKSLQEFIIVFPKHKKLHNAQKSWDSRNHNFFFNILHRFLIVEIDFTHCEIY